MDIGRGVGGEDAGADGLDAVGGRRVEAAGAGFGEAVDEVEGG